MVIHLKCTSINTCMKVSHLIENLDFRRAWKKNKKSLLSMVKFGIPDPTLSADGITVELISTPAEHRGKGAASKTMNVIIGLADAHDVTIFLSPEALGQGLNGTLRQQELTQWYSRLGFIPVENDNRYWVRIPK